MMSSERLELALHTLGEVLQDRELTYDLIAIGGGALLLQDLDRAGLLSSTKKANANVFISPNF